jgi:hypothetical protein
MHRAAVAAHGLAEDLGIDGNDRLGPDGLKGPGHGVVRTLI